MATDNKKENKICQDKVYTGREFIAKLGSVPQGPFPLEFG